MRALAIARHLPEGEVIFAGSALRRAGRVIPAGIRCIDLPLDTPAPGESVIEPIQSQVRFAHYTPYGLNGLKARSHALTALFHQHPEILLFVDVSVEIALLARLCGVPYVYVRQHGLRNDMPHQFAYEAAELIIAPYSEEMSHADQEGLFGRKTLFSGGFSRYTGRHAEHRPAAKRIAVFAGEGGTCFDAGFLIRLSKQLPEAEIHVVGNLQMGRNGEEMPNCMFHEYLPDPAGLLLTCRAVIANAGHNAVMEIADLGLPFICVPAERPFREQEIKAEHLERLKLAMIVQPADLHTVSWSDCIQDAIALRRQAGIPAITDPNAFNVIASRLMNLHEQLFSAPSCESADEDFRTHPHA